MIDRPKVRITWKSVAYFKELGHGVEVYYNPDPKKLDLDGRFHGDGNSRILVAFVVDFQWLHGTSNVAEVRLLRSASPKFAELGVDGNEVIAEAKPAIEPYVANRRPFPRLHMVPADKLKNREHMSDPIGKRLTVWVNG